MPLTRLRQVGGDRFAAEHDKLTAQKINKENKADRDGFGGVILLVAERGRYERHPEGKPACQQLVQNKGDGIEGKVTRPLLKHRALLVILEGPVFVEQKIAGNSQQHANEVSRNDLVAERMQNSVPTHAAREEVVAAK